MRTLFTSDTHFNHANIIKYCRRPFATAEEMNREMISRWNAAVRPEDTVYHLGDFAMGQGQDIASILRQLHGARIILVRGNHDKPLPRMLQEGFAEVHEKLEWNGWLLQHHPMNTDRKLLCGHIHEKWRRIRSTINVGVDVWDFTPRTLEELLSCPQSPLEYNCRYCGATLRHLEDNSRHYDGRCLSI